MATEPTIINVDTLAAPTVNPLGQLCFTALHSDGRVDLWAPAAVDGNWNDQCIAGSEHAAEAVRYIRESGNAALLPGIVRTIVERGAFGGVEVGFFSALSQQLRS